MGPAITLDAITEVLAIGVGTLSGNHTSLLRLCTQILLKSVCLAIETGKNFGNFGFHKMYALS